MSTWWAGVGCLRLSAGRLPVISFLITEPILGWSEAPLHQPLGAALGAPPRAVLAPIIPPGLSPHRPPLSLLLIFLPCWVLGLYFLEVTPPRWVFMTECLPAPELQAGREAGQPPAPGCRAALWPYGGDHQGTGCGVADCPGCVLRGPELLAG